MPCDRCSSERVAKIGGKCTDLFHAELGTIQQEGYVDDRWGVGGGDYIEIKLCMDCGKVQGTFPITDAALAECGCGLVADNGTCDC